MNLADCRALLAGGAARVHSPLQQRLTRDAPPTQARA
jgi:hypothetical protein